MEDRPERFVYEDGGLVLPEGDAGIKNQYTTEPRISLPLSGKHGNRKEDATATRSFGLRGLSKMRQPKLPRLAPGPPDRPPFASFPAFPSSRREKEGRSAAAPPQKRPGVAKELQKLPPSQNAFSFDAEHRRREADFPSSRRAATVGRSGPTDRLPAPMTLLSTLCGHARAGFRRRP